MYRIGLLAALLTACTPAAFGQQLHIQFEVEQFASPEAAEAYLRQTASGAAITISDLNLTAGTAGIEGAPGRLFRADPVYRSVVEDAASPVGHRYELDLSNETAIAMRGEVTPLRPHRRTGWAGEQLRVVAYSGTGEQIAEAFVADPRFVRYEGWDGDGAHIAGSNHSFVQDVPLPPLAVSLPANAARIEVYDQAGSIQAPADGRRIGIISATRIVAAPQ